MIWSSDHCNCCSQGFVRPSSREMLICGSNPADVLDQLEAFQRRCRMNVCARVGRLSRCRHPRVLMLVCFASAAPPSIIQLAADGKLPPNARG
jgi:hypothetical protein